MKIKALALAAPIALAGLTATVLAEDRADVLERIAPIGKANVSAPAEPAPIVEPAAAEAPAAETAEATTAEAPAAEAPATEAPAAEAPAAAEAEAPAAAAPAAGDQLALATSSGCMACHQVETKVVGPAYTEVAAKYKGDDAAADMLVAKVKSGGVGTWGQIPMPPNPHVPDDDLRAIINWVLSL